ncbi:hypothetical protein LJC59_08090, partial [Desulfovibrio sp. OttesenSCG-928-A18]|nr:hypothetical protein [Desulfovibrio sp. OttesenSCG-928-A18]
MKAPVMQRLCAGAIRSLFRFALSCLPVPLLGIALLCPAKHAAGAELHWEQLPDRERIRIELSVMEGMPGRVGRIAPNGVLVPFTDMPAGLHVAEPPKDARLFKGTQHQGRALVLLTQTPEFGFVVTKNSPEEIIVDFFHNPLGARWKATGPATATELVPDIAVTPLTPPDADNLALQQDPQGKKAQSAPTPTGQKPEPGSSAGGPAPAAPSAGTELAPEPAA